MLAERGSEIPCCITYPPAMAVIEATTETRGLRRRRLSQQNIGHKMPVVKKNVQNLGASKTAKAAKVAPRRIITRNVRVVWNVTN
jgi:hypothetical protein